MANVTRCGECEHNKEYPNSLWKALPPEHHCSLMFDASQPHGKVIFNPNGVPGWCPLAGE